MSRFSRRTGAQRSADTKAVESAYLSLVRTQRALAFMLVFCAVLGATVLHPASQAPRSVLYLPIIFATSLLTFAYMLRNVMVQASLSELRRDPRNPALLRRWSRNNLLVLALCAAVGLIGFALQLLGAPLSLAIAVYVIAVSYLFLLRPMRP
jgi:hypothetical protein